jgi:hypothetical protein
MDTSYPPWMWEISRDVFDFIAVVTFDRAVATTISDTVVPSYVALFVTSLAPSLSHSRICLFYPERAPLESIFQCLQGVIVLSIRKDGGWGKSVLLLHSTEMWGVAIGPANFTILTDHIAWDPSRWRRWVGCHNPDF